MKLMIHDRADELRFAIVGRFAGECVDEVRTAWQRALHETASRQITIDISRLTGYEAGGRKLLRDMYQHGTQFAAGTATALVFLNEISTQQRQTSAMVPETAAPRKKSDKVASRIRAIASGE